MRKNNVFIVYLVLVSVYGTSLAGGLGNSNKNDITQTMQACLTIQKGYSIGDAYYSICPGDKSEKSAQTQKNFENELNKFNCAALLSEQQKRLLFEESFASLKKDMVADGANCTNGEKPNFNQ